MLLEQLQQVDFVIASRFHNVLLGLMLGKPAISLSYEAKHEALMASFGLSAYCQTFDRVDVPQLTRQFQQLEQQAADMLPDHRSTGGKKSRELAEQYELLARLIGPRTALDQLRIKRRAGVRLQDCRIRPLASQLHQITLEPAVFDFSAAATQ